MAPHQAITNTVAKHASSSELNKWRAQGVDPELLYAETTPLPLSPQVVSLEQSKRPVDSLARPLGAMVAQRHMEQAEA